MPKVKSRLWATFHVRIWITPRGKGKDQMLINSTIPISIFRKLPTIKTIIARAQPEIFLALERMIDIKRKDEKICPLHGPKNIGQRLPPWSTCTCSIGDKSRLISSTR